ncbi:MAG: hypothetical protein AB2A00_23195 [Myxococcota bacterium]
MKRVFTHPIIFTVALIEFCTGVLRNGVMHWFPIYAKEIWVLPGMHPLVNGDWHAWEVTLGLVAVAAGLSMASRGGRMRALGLGLACLGLVPFVPAGWGGLLFAAGVLGGNVAGWVSDLFFQSRRAPAAGGLYAGLGICTLWMILALGDTSREVAWVKDKDGPLKVGDEIVSVAGQADVKNWSEISRAFACVRSTCVGGSHWDGQRCMCTGEVEADDTTTPLTTGSIPMTIKRDGQTLEISLVDKAKEQRAGDRRVLQAGPRLTLSPFWLGLLVFLISICVIGTHGLLSGTATMDFGGRKGAATATAMIDGFVYLGTAVQSLALGFLTTKDWLYWPLFLAPWAFAGFLLCTRIWHAKPAAKGGGH